MGDVISIFKNKKDLRADTINFYQNDKILKDGLLILGENFPKEFFPFGRVGLEIFNQTSLWFFVNIGDLSEESFRSASSFHELGRMCIFISDLSLVCLDKQKIIFESSLLSEGDSPRIISVVNQPIQDLIEQGLVLPALANQLKKVSIDKPPLDKDLGTAVKEIVRQVSKEIKN